MGKLNLVYFSASGTTKSVATSYAKKSNREITEYDLLRQPPEQFVTFATDTPAVFAVPVYAGRVPALCAEALKHFKGNKTPAVAVVVYGNREYDDALRELCDLLSANDFVVAAAAAFVAQHSIFPVVASGRPDDKDNQVIASFSEKCEKAFSEFSGTETITVKGNTTYREPSAIPLRPTGNSKCNACGACVKICPPKAIEANTPRKTDKSRCISCTACIAVCPQKARAFHGLLYRIVEKSFAKKNTSRKEPELFYAEH